MGELARQVMEPQVYPDLREYPEGPPEQPYDAAGLDAALSDGCAGRRRPCQPLDGDRCGDALSWLEAAPLCVGRGGRRRQCLRFAAVSGVGFDDESRRRRDPYRPRAGWTGSG